MLKTGIVGISAETVGVGGGRKNLTEKGGLGESLFNFRVETGNADSSLRSE
jgi:hypothetical protein